MTFVKFVETSNEPCAFAHPLFQSHHTPYPTSLLSCALSKVRMPELCYYQRRHPPAGAHDDESENMSFVICCSCCLILTHRCYSSGCGIWHACLHSACNRPNFKCCVGCCFNCSVDCADARVSLNLTTSLERSASRSYRNRTHAELIPRGYMRLFFGEGPHGHGIIRSMWCII